MVWARSTKKSCLLRIVVWCTMPRRGRKCHSAHKFGSKGGKNAPHTPAAVAANGTVTTALPDSDVEAPTESRQHRNGLDTHDSSGDTDRAQQRADEKVAGSSSSSDSPRSGEGNVRDSHPPESEPDYMIVDLDCINALIARSLCPTCSASGRDSLSIVTAGRARDGLSSRLRLVCRNCGILKESE